MSAESLPIVRRKFKYGKKNYKPGDVFQPEGGRNDTVILKSSLIVYKTSPKSETDQSGKANDHETNSTADTNQQGLSNNRAKQHRNRAK